MDLLVYLVTGPLGDWSGLVHHQLLPMLVHDDKVVRKLLRTGGVLPCGSDGLAADAVFARLTEMTLHSWRPPPFGTRGTRELIQPPRTNE
jgi:hypothetical protein